MNSLENFLQIIWRNQDLSWYHKGLFLQGAAWYESYPEKKDILYFISGIAFYRSVNK